MSVAVFSADPVLSRMLELEAKRCELSLSSPEQAEVWLIDLDSPVPLPGKGKAAFCVGFSAKELEAPPQQVDLLLRLPFSAAALGRVLRQKPMRLHAELRREGNALWLSGKKLHFSRIEQQLLTLLIQNHHRVVTPIELAEVIGESAEKTNAVAVYLYRLRHKLEADGMTRIRTVRGVGYQWMGD